MASPLVIEGGRWDIAQAILNIAGPAAASDDQEDDTAPADPGSGESHIDSTDAILRLVVSVFGVIFVGLLAWILITFAIEVSGPIGFLLILAVVAVVGHGIWRFVVHRLR